MASRRVNSWIYLGPQVRLTVMWQTITNPLPAITMKTLFGQHRSVSILIVYMRHLSCCTVTVLHIVQALRDETIVAAALSRATRVRIADA